MAIFYANHRLWLFAVWQTLPFFCMLHVWGLPEMTDVWIYERLLTRICIKVLDLLTKMNFAIQSVFISTYAIISNSQFSVSDIPAPKAFNHRSLATILLTESDPSWHRGFIMTARWYMPARSHSFTVLKPHGWPLQRHVDCDGWKTEPGYPWISARQGASVKTDCYHYLLASQPDDYKETLNSGL